MRDPDDWWPSIERTVFEALLNPRDGAVASALEPVRQFTLRMLATRFTPKWHDKRAAKDALIRHDAAVRAAIPKDRFIEWRAGDGWGPICEGLGLAIFDEPLPHVKTSADVRSRLTMD